MDHLATSIRRCAVAILSSILLFSCYPGSDAESFHREWEKDRQRRIAAMREATKTTARGRSLEGAALQSFLSDRTHVFAYETTPDGRRDKYVEWNWFRADGRLVYLNTLWATDPEGSSNDKWSVDDRRVCILNTHFSQDEQCYAIAVTADGRVQYFISQPGDPADGLLTKVTNEVYEGAPRVK